MAYEECSKTVTLIAGADLRNAEATVSGRTSRPSVVGEVVAINTAGRVVKAPASTGAIIGVLASDVRANVSTSGKPVTVAVIGGGGILKMKAGAAITAGQLIVPDATAGRVAGVANIAGLGANQMAVGVALTAAADGDVFPVLAQTIVGPNA